MAVSGQKKLRTVDEKGRWERLNPEILALIFVRIPADEMVRIVPSVCKSWMEAVAGAYCWLHIDIAEWCRRRNESSAVDLAARKLVRRSRSIFQRLSAYRLGDSGFVLIGPKLSSKSLQALREYYEIPVIGKAHRAMADVNVLALVLQRLTRDLQLTVPSLLQNYTFRASESSNNAKKKKNPR